MSTKSLGNKVLLATWLGWMFDGFDIALYPLVANQALSELIGANNPDFGVIASILLGIFLVGWALGGIIFGYLGDKIGRVKALSLCILTYAIFTGFCGFVQSIELFTLFRFLAGLGMGGEWTLGVALLAESIESKDRIQSTAILSTGAACGYLLSIVVYSLINPLGWRAIFLVGVIPAFLVFYIRKNIEEPKAWANLKQKLELQLRDFVLTRDEH